MHVCSTDSDIVEERNETVVVNTTTEKTSLT
jgi:hypothetical protein